MSRIGSCADQDAVSIEGNSHRFHDGGIHGRDQAIDRFERRTTASDYTQCQQGSHRLHLKRLIPFNGSGTDRARRAENLAVKPIDVWIALQPTIGKWIRGCHSNTEDVQHHEHRICDVE